MIKTTIAKTASIKLHIEHIPFRKTVSGILIAMSFNVRGIAVFNATL